MRKENYPKAEEAHSLFLSDDHFRLILKRQAHNKIYTSWPAASANISKGERAPHCFLTGLGLTSSKKREEKVKKNTWFPDTSLGTMVMPWFYPFWIAEGLKLGGITLSTPLCFFSFPLVSLHLHNRVNNRNLRLMTKFSLSQVTQIQSKCNTRILNPKKLHIVRSSWKSKMINAED